MFNLVIIQVNDEAIQFVVDSLVFSATDVRTMGPAARMVALQHKLASMSDRTGKYWKAKRDSTIRALEILSRISK